MNCVFDNSEIRERLMGIFNRRFRIKPEVWNTDILSKHLLGRDIGLVPRDLLYLYFDIEKEFKICISENCIIAGRFSSFESIVEIIAEHLEKPLAAATAG